MRWTITLGLCSWLVLWQLWWNELWFVAFALILVFGSGLLLWLLTEIDFEFLYPSDAFNLLVAAVAVHIILCVAVFLSGVKEQESATLFSLTLYALVGTALTMQAVRIRRKDHK